MCYKRWCKNDNIILEQNNKHSKKGWTFTHYNCRDGSNFPLHAWCKKLHGKYYFHASHAGLMCDTCSIHTNIWEMVNSRVECSFVCRIFKWKSGKTTGITANRKGDRQYIHIVQCTGHLKKENTAPPHLTKKLTNRSVWQLIGYNN